MKYLKSLFLLLLIYIAAPNLCFSQFEISETPEGFPSKHSFWVDGGVGYTTMGIGAIANITYQPVDSFIVSIGATGSWDHWTKAVQSREYYATAGLVFKGKRSVATFEGGLSYGNYFQTDIDYIHNQLTVTEYRKGGLAFQGKYFYTPIKYLGIGIQIFADVNGYQTHGAILLCVAMGLVR